MILGILTTVISGIVMLLPIVFWIAIVLTEATLSPFGLFIAGGLMLSAGITGIVYGSRRRQGSLIASLMLYALAALFCMLQEKLHGVNSIISMLFYFNILGIAVRGYQFF